MRNPSLIILFFFFFQSVYSQNNPCADVEAYHIVVLGSSTAAGAGASNTDSAWVNRYRNLLKSVNPENEVTNLAVGGFTTYRIMPTGFSPPANRPLPNPNRNITAAISLQPDGIIVNLPSNDVSSGYSVEEQLANFDTIVQHATNAGIPIWICTTQPKNYNNNSVLIQRQLDVRDSILVKYDPYTIDFWTGLADSTNQINAFYDYGDGTHLNDDGHGLLFQKVRDKDLPALLFQSNSEFPDYTFADFNLLEMPNCGNDYVYFNAIVYNRGLPGAAFYTVDVDARDASGNGTLGTQIKIDEPLGTCEFDTIEVPVHITDMDFYEIAAAVTSVDDGNVLNDSVFSSLFVPGVPSIEAVADTGCSGDEFLLQAIAHPADSIRWWDAPNGGNVIGGGAFFETPPLSATTTYYAEAVRGSFHYGSEISAAESFNVKWNGHMFDLIANEELIIDSLAMIIADSGSQLVDIYIRSGSHLGYETNFSSWQYYGFFPVEVTDTNNLTTIDIAPLTIPANDTMAIYLQLSNPSSRLGYLNNGSTGTFLTDELTLLTGSGSSHNFGGSFYPRIWNGKLFYHFGEKPDGDCSTERVSIEAFVQQVEVDLGVDTILDISESYVLGAGGGFSSYLWSDGSSDSMLTLNGNDLGMGVYTYVVTVTNDIGCSASDTVVVAFAPLLGTGEEAKEIGFQFFPNPVDQVLSIELGEGNWQLQVIATNGVTMQTDSFRCNGDCRNALDVSGLTPGIYFIEVKKDNQMAAYFRLVVF